MEESVTIHLQEMLMNITENKFETILDLIFNSIYITSKENLFLLVHNFFIAASCRPKNMMIYSRLLYSLYTLPTSKPTVLKYLPQAIKHESQCNQYPPFYFFYCLKIIYFSLLPLPFASERTTPPSGCIKSLQD